MELDRFDWLAKRKEKAIDADRRIVDPHHHLWNRGGSTYLADELLADTGGSHNVTHTVFVECRSKYDREGETQFAPVGETRFVAAEAATTHGRDGARIAAIVAFADMMLGKAVADVLAAHEAAANGLFRGVRHATAWDADPAVPAAHTGATEAIMTTSRFRAGVGTLAAMGYSFDAWLYHPQIGELVDMARALPEVSIVLNHLGAPLGIGPYAEQSGEVRAAWRQSLIDAASCENVNLKVGGIGMDHYFGLGWAERAAPPSSEEVAARWSDDVRWCIDLFGPDRCMFESNFPVDRQTLPYVVLWNALQIMADGYSDPELDQLFAGTADRVYRLDTGMIPPR